MSETGLATEVALYKDLHHRWHHVHRHLISKADIGAVEHEAKVV